MPLAVGRGALVEFGEAAQLRLQEQVRSNRVNGQGHAVVIDFHAPVRRQRIVASAVQAKVTIIDGAFVGDDGQPLRQAYGGQTAGQRLV